MIANDMIRTGPDDEIDLIGISRTLWRYKVLLAATTFLCAAIAVVMALTAIPLFRAEALVTEVTEQQLGGQGSLGRIEGLASLVGVNLNAGGDSVRAKAVLQSRKLVEEFIKRNQLIPVLFPKAQTPPSLWKAVEKFRRDVLAIKEDPRRNTISVTVIWTDAASAAKWANDLVALANELLRNDAIAESERNINYLKQQVRGTDVVQLQTVMYNLVESEMQKLMLANGRIEYAFVVADPAVAPEIRSSPKRTIMVIIGALIGMILGVAIAFTRETVIKYRTDGARAGAFA